MLRRQIECKKIYEGFNTEEMLEEINAVTELYTYTSKNRSKVWYSIPLHTEDGKIDPKSNDIKQIEKKIFKPTEILNACPYIKSIIDNLDTKVYLVRILKLNAGGVIPKHIDFDFEDPNYIRCHIPIVTDELVEFYINNKKYNLTTGALWYTNVAFEHTVINKSQIDRIHIVLDLELTNDIQKILDS